jgi:putative ABC transport system permease protein
VLKSKGDRGFFNFDDQVVVPCTVAMKQLFGLDYLPGTDVQAEEGGDLTAVENELTALLRKRHRAREGADSDLEVPNQADMIRASTDITKAFTFPLGGIASISLPAGGIGIMNVMLVTERTREIGVRTAIGPKRSNIRTRFLIEAMIISGLGGLIGSGIGIVGARIIAATSPFPALVEWSGVLPAISFSGMAGIFFGWYPARRAAALDTIEALRYE